MNTVSAGLIVAMAAACLSLYASESPHAWDMGQIDPKAISQGKLGPRSFSPYANRKFPPRPLWGDQHVHTGWSFDAGFLCTLSPEDALRFARGEEVKSTFGVPARLSRPLDWLVMTDHSDSLGVTSEVRAGNPKLMEDPTLKKWNEAMGGGIETSLPAAFEAIEMQGLGTLPDAVKDPAFALDIWGKYTALVEIQMPKEVPMITQERAYTSPIWYRPL